MQTAQLEPSEQALAHLRAGRIREAESIYRRLLSVMPTHADALRGMAFIAHQEGRPDEAAEYMARAVTAHPRDARLRILQAQLLKAAGRVEQARATLEAATEAAPGSAEAWLALGVLLRGQGRLEAALRCYERAATLAPDDPAAFVNLGNVLATLGRNDAAETAYRRATEVAPHMAEAWANLGKLLLDTNRAEGAARSLRIAVELDPECAMAHFQWSRLSLLHGDATEAIASARRALAIDPTSMDARSMLADALCATGANEAGIHEYDAILLQHADAPAWIHSNRLMTLNYLARVDAGALAEAHAQLEGRFGVVESRARAVDSAPGKRLRIGYVSADFREHSVSYFVEPVWSSRDRGAVEVVGYYNNVSGDGVTQRLRGLADGWVECGEMSDEALVRRIEEDRIDILVDLSGHTGGNRLGVFARKAAPVQVSWLGYPTSTGLRAIDYRLSDWEVDPAGWERYSVEEVVRLPGSYYCYRPPGDAPDVSALPALGRGQVRYGSFNNLAKLSDEVLVLWGRILGAVPGARLVLKSRTLRDAGVRARVLERLAGVGIAAERVEIHGWAAQARSHLELYGEVDIGLDTWPYNGATTTCEALWMGVPVVTLRGGTHAGRMGASLMKAAGLGEWVAASEEEYVALAVVWAGRLEALSELRAGLRERLRGSALLDEAGFTRALEAAYRGMWERWCAGAQRGPVAG